jgi:hypothetical protein
VTALASVSWPECLTESYLLDRKDQRRIPTPNRQRKRLGSIHSLTQLIDCTHTHSADRENDVVRTQAGLLSGAAVGNVLDQHACVVSSVRQRSAFECWMNLCRAVSIGAAALAD